MSKKPVPQNVELGDLVRDKVTGFTGVAIGVTKWIHGCDRISVQPVIPKGATEHKLPEATAFDIMSLEVLEKRKVVSDNTPRPLGELLGDAPVKKAATGGPATPAERSLMRSGR